MQVPRHEEGYEEGHKEVYMEPYTEVAGYIPQQFAPHGPLEDTEEVTEHEGLRLLLREATRLIEREDLCRASETLRKAGELASGEGSTDHESVRAGDRLLDTGEYTSTGYGEKLAPVAPAITATLESLAERGPQVTPKNN